MQMEGIFTPIITPHHEDGAIDHDGFAGVVDFLIENGVACIIVGGSTVSIMLRRRPSALK